MIIVTPVYPAKKEYYRLLVKIDGYKEQQVTVYEGADIDDAIDIMYNKLYMLGYTDITYIIPQ